VRSMDDLQARPLPGTDGSTRPFWSPDSRYLGFVAGGKLKKVPLAGGPPQTLADTPTGSDGSWSTIGVILFDGRGSDPIKRVAASGGTPQDFVTPDPDSGITSVGWPEFLPDGRRFLYVANGVQPDERFLMVGDIDGKQPPRKLLDVASLVRFAPPDHLLYIRENSLLSQPFDPDAAELKGEAVPLAEQLGTTAVGLADFSASTDGTLIYRSGWTAKRRLVWTDRNGRELGDADEPAVYRDTALSPDGKRLAITIEDPSSGNRDIWIRDLERGVTSRFTFDPGRDGAPVFSPDGTSIVFASNRAGGSYDLYVKDASGSGPARELLTTENNLTPCDWSRDGHWLAYHANGGETTWDVWVLAMDGEEKGTATPFVQGPFIEVVPRFSPDGRWIVYLSDESGRFEVYVQPFTGPGGKWQVSTDGGDDPMWSAGGREILYVAPGGALMSVPVTLGTTFTAGSPRDLFQVRLQPMILRNRWLATPDGERFLFLQPEGTNRSLPMTVVLNWAEALPER
jgi:Tol biopolymer transport system component